MARAFFEHLSISTTTLSAGKRLMIVIGQAPTMLQTLGPPAFPVAALAIGEP